MPTVIARRAVSGVVLIASLLFLTFFVFNVIPTNPACLVVACGPHTSTNDADIRAADHRLGIDRSFIDQYGRFVWHVARHGDFGTSWTTKQNVGSELTQALPVTASLVVGGMTLMLLLAFPLGCFTALRPRSIPDRGLLAVSVIGLAIHPFVLGIGLRDLFSRHLGAPTSGYCPIGRAGGACAGVSSWAAHLAVPWLVFALLFLPFYMRLVRTRLLETLNEPYISTARAKGASETRVVIRHALSNAVGPVLPFIAIDAGTAITAAIYIETVFGLPGLGHLAVQAFSGEAGGYDLPLTAGLVTIVGLFVVTLNVLADAAGAWFDPRVRLQTARSPSILLRINARPRIRFAVGAVVVIAVVIAAFELGQSHSSTKTSTAATTETLVPHLADSFELSSTGPDKAAKIRTTVSKILVGADGWQVYASITNDSDRTIPIFQPNPGLPVFYPLQGMSLVVTAPPSSGTNRFSVISAREFIPPLPRALAPHQTWKGSFGGSDTVPRKRQIYVGYGQFILDSRTLAGSSSRSIVVE